MTHDAATQPYEAPCIQDRTSIDIPLVAVTSELPAQSAAFRTL